MHSPSKMLPVCAYSPPRSMRSAPSFLYCPAFDIRRWRNIFLDDDGGTSTNQKAPVQDQVQAEAPSQVWWQVGICGHQRVWQATCRERRGTSRCQTVHYRSWIVAQGQKVTPGSDGNAEPNRQGRLLAQGADAVSPYAGSSPRPSSKC